MLVKLTLLKGNVIYVNVVDIELVEEDDGGNAVVFLRTMQQKLYVKEKADEIHFTILNQLRYVNGVE